MKSKMIHFVALCSFGIMAALSSPLAAIADEHTSATLRSSLENHLNQALKIYDERAFSVVSLNEEKVSENLPGTPFSYQNLVVATGDDPESLKVKITVFESKKETEAKTQDVIKNVLNEAGFKQAKVGYSLLPDAEVSTNTASKDKETSKEESAFARNGILVATLLISILLGVIAFRSKKIETSLGEGLKQLSETIQSSAENSEGRRASAAPIESDRQNYAQSAQSSASGAAAIQQFSDQALHACFTDCYWVKNDSYASYLWQNMSVVQRKNLLKAHPFLNEYVSWVAKQTPVDQGCIADPYYLDPKALALVDQAKLQKWVSEKPEWFFAVSKLRSESLDLPVNEKMNLFEKRAEFTDRATTLKADLLAVESSEPRKLPSTFKIQLRTIEDEQALLSHEHLTLEMLTAVDTLGILLKLPEARIESILNRYTAKDLVSAWIAPAEVLTGLEKFISPKKLEIVRSYQGKIQPSRDSRAYKEMITLSHEVLRSMMKETPDSSPERKAA